MKYEKTVFLIIIVSLLFAFVGCDGELKDQHVWDEGTIVKQATCTQEGLRTFTCSHCSATKTEPVAALGHDFTTKIADEKYVASQPTAEKAAEYYYICSRCGEKGTETFTHGQPHVHEWVVEKTTEATCVLEGSIEYSCSTCKATKTDVIKVLGHDFSKEVVDEKYLAIAAAEGKNSTYYKSCSRCGEKGSETFEHKHSWDEGSISKSATCTEKGEKTFKCTIEGCKETKIEEVQALGHDYKEVVDERYLKTAATKEKAAEYYESCSRCKEKGSKTFVHGEPLTHEHIWDNGSVTKEPGCVEAGEKTFKCTVEGCDGTKKEPLDAFGHDFKEVADEKYLKNEASFTNPAVYYKSCTSCGEKSEETFEYGEVLPHEHDFIYEADEANLKFFTPTPVHGVCRYCNAESEDTKELYKPLEGFWVSESFSIDKIDTYYMISFDASDVAFDIVLTGENEKGKVISYGQEIECEYSRVSFNSDNYLRIEYQEQPIDLKVAEEGYDSNGHGVVVVEMTTETDPTGDGRRVRFARVDIEPHEHVFAEEIVERDSLGHYRATSCSRKDLHKEIDALGKLHVYGSEDPSACSICGYGRYCTLTFLDSDGETVYLKDERVEKGLKYTLPKRVDIEGGWKVERDDSESLYGAGDSFWPEEDTVFIFDPCGDFHSYGYQISDEDLLYFTPTSVVVTCWKCGREENQNLYRPLDGYWMTDEKVVNGQNISFGLSISGNSIINESFSDGYVSYSSGFDSYSITELSSSDYPQITRMLHFERVDESSSLTFAICSETDNKFTVAFPIDEAGNLVYFEYKKVLSNGHFHMYGDYEFFIEEDSSWTGHVSNTECTEHRTLKCKEEHSYSDGYCSVCECPVYYAIVFKESDLSEDEYYRYATKDDGYILHKPLKAEGNAWKNVDTGEVLMPGVVIKPIVDPDYKTITLVPTTVSVIE